MRTSRFAPLALLIPAVVLAQPTPVPSSQGGMPPPQAGMLSTSTMTAPPVSAPSVNPAKAADALNAAKKQAKELKSMLPSNGDVGTSGSGWGFS